MRRQGGAAYKVPARRKEQTRNRKEWYYGDKNKIRAQPDGLPAHRRPADGAVRIPVCQKERRKFILRIEDTDRERLVDEASEIIYRTLKDTGLIYDEGPDVGGEYGPYIQSERKDIYRDYAEELVRCGAAYYCFCTKERLSGLRTECEAKGEQFKYDKHCLSLTPEEVRAKVAAGEPYVIRQNIPTEGETTYSDMVYGDVTVPNSDMEDNILLKSDGYPTYNLANVVDDHLMKITHVIRGIEYLSSTPQI